MTNLKASQVLRIFICSLITILFSNFSNAQSSCSCVEYIYINEPGPNGAPEGKIHKLQINQDGSLTEIGTPWFDNATELPRPHGLGTDLNGYLYIGGSSGDDVRKLDCDGNIFPTSDFHLPDDGGWNFASIDNNLYINRPQTEDIGQFDICSGQQTGYVDYCDFIFVDWGFYYDDRTGYFYSAGAAFNNESSLVYRFTIDDFQNGGGNCIQPFIETDDNVVNVGDNELPDTNIAGITTDTDGNIYIAVGGFSGGSAGQSSIWKYDANGNFIASTATDSNDGDGGWYNLVGVVYSETNGLIYTSNGTTNDDCISIFDTDLNYLGAAIGATAPGGTPPPFGEASKAIAKNLECCPTTSPVIVDQTYCQPVVGEKLFLNELFPCDGIICGGEWMADAGNTGMTYNDCEQSITIDNLEACGTFTKSSSNVQCGAFELTFNVETLTQPDVSVVSSGSQICQDVSSIDLTASSNTPNVTYQWQMSTDGCDGTWMDISGATSDSYQVTGIVQETYFRVVSSVNGNCSNGSCDQISDCITISFANACRSCDCQEYLYVNERDAGTVHKFLVNADGSLNEINPTGPWYPDGDPTQLPSPHGLGTDLNGFLYIAENWNDSNADIRKLDCDGNIFDESDFQLNAQAFNIVSIDNMLVYNQPGGGTGPGFALDWTSIETADLCSGASQGTACFLDDMGGNVSVRWGFWKDHNDTFWAYSTNGGDFIYQFTIDEIQSGTCISPLIAGAAGDLFDLNREQARGITTDLDGNIYIVNAQSFGGPAKVRKYDQSGNILAETLVDSNEGDGGYYGAVGLVYVETCNCLYSANYTTLDDCVTKYSLDLQTIEAVVGPVPGSPSNNDDALGGKALASLKECCPNTQPQVIDQLYCGGRIGDKVFLNDIYPCDGIVCGAAWIPDINNVGVTFDDCEQSFTIDSNGACATFTKSGSNAQCGSYDITYNVEFIVPVETTISAPELYCEEQTIEITSSTTGTPSSYQWQESTTGCDGTWVDIASATADTYTASGISQETSFRLLSLYSGNCATGNCADTSNCVTITPIDDVVTAPIISWTDNICEPETAGSFNVDTDCQAGTTIEYSIDGGNTWSATAPMYTSSVVTVRARCVDDASSCPGPETADVSSAPEICCVTPSAPAISVTDNTCNPDVNGNWNIDTACEPGSTLEWSTDGGMTWSTDVPTYTLTSMTVTARCLLDADPNCFSDPLSGVSSAPNEVTATPELSWTDNICDPLTDGLLNIDTQCPNGTTIEFSVDGGTNWSTTAPTYSTDNAITVRARCVDDVTTCEGPESTDIMSAPENCFDLALTKTLSTGQAAYIAPDDDVNFTITVYNQGGVDAQNILVNDYVPNGYSFDPALNSDFGPDSDGDGNPDATIVGPLAAGANTTLEITLTVNDPFDVATMDLVNYAEIGYAEDTNGNNTGDGSLVDSDSPYDSDPTNDAGGTPDGADDDFVNGDGSGSPLDGTDTTDEDDQDPAYVEIFDLALKKTLGPTQDSNVSPGDEVSYSITVYNQGSDVVQNIVVNDYLTSATAYTFDSALNTDFVLDTDGDTNPDATIAGPLAPGDSMVLEIVLTVSNPFNGGNLENSAEISYAEDDNGNNTADGSVVDYDSTPDTTDGNDGGGFADSDSDDAVDGDGSGSPDDTSATTDEDDQDIAYVTIFDLALRKELSMNQDIHVAPGDTVSFDVWVINQTPIDAYDVLVNDYVPSGMMFSQAINPTWVSDSDGDGNPDITIAGPILGMDSFLAQIKLIVNDPFDVQNMSLINYAEIGYAEDENGNNTADGTLADGDSPYDTDPMNDAGGTPDGPDDNFVDGNGTGNPLDGNANSDEDDQDPAYVEIFDLALSKQRCPLQDQFVEPGDLVCFDITVSNQGTDIAQNILVNDYMPSGYSFDPANNPLWNVDSDGDGNPDRVYEGPLMPGTSATLTIYLEVNDPFDATSMDLVNYAEISFAEDDDGNNTADGSVVDYDSTPDSDPVNDAGGTPDGDDDDYIDGDGSGNPLDGVDTTDEDDQDPAYVEIFDLALAKMLSSGQSQSVAPGDDISFDIVVSNQGTTEAYNTIINDYVPNGYTFDPALNPLWNADSDGDGQPDYTIEGPLAQGASITLSLVLTVNDPFDPASMSLYNWAEISYSEDDGGNNTADGTLVDIDSTPDNDPSNDAGGTPDGADDNYINGDGSGNPLDGVDTSDEDDQDPAYVYIFDLALSKVRAMGQAQFVAPGDDVSYEITVTNQGSEPSANILVNDYAPNGYTFDPALNAVFGPDSDGDGNPDATIAGPLAPGASMTLSITLTVNDPFDPASMDLVNYAEIASAEDHLGNTTDSGDVTDIDSTPDTNPSNDAGGTPDGADDSFIDGDGSGSPLDGVDSTDEDDQDPAYVEIFDLALSKTRAVGQSEYTVPGGTVTYTITVSNQGNTDGYNILVNDYVPNGYTFDPALNSDFGPDTDGDGNPDALIEGPLAFGQAVNLDIVLTVNNPFDPNTMSLLNYAEISYAEDDDGNNTDNGTLVDYDSTADTDPSNDAGGTPDGADDDYIEGDGTGEPLDGVDASDEDDQDPAYVDIFDLALQKVLSNGQNFYIAPGDDVSFDITVSNQGTVAAYNTLINDYMPNGFTFDPALNADFGPDSDGDGNPDAIITGPLMPGASMTLTIVLSVKDPFDPASMSLLNYAEISYTEDEDGNNTSDGTLEDADSTPDADPSNDAGGTPDGADDDALFGDGTGTPLDGVDTSDEDDQDPAYVEIFDLALVKDLTTGQSSLVTPGSTVSFDIAVLNQGTTEAINILVNDYIPNGFSFDPALNPTWNADSDGDGNPDIVIPGPLAPAASATVTIVLNVNNPFDELTMSSVNYAEISYAEEASGDNTADGTLPDVDSTPDNIPDNDAGGTPEGPDDNYLDGDGSGVPLDGTASTDEDDQDPAFVEVGIFDLALQKVLSPTQVLPVYQGDLVTFNITVTNQGEVSATNIQITDYIPSGFVLADALWSSVGPDIAEITLTVTIPAGGIEIIPITLQVVDGTAAGDYINYAEISDAEDLNGNHPEDIDSTPDENDSNDAGGTSEGPEDNFIDGDGTGSPQDGVASTDEDDHDPALVPVEVFDLALIKTLAVGQADVVAPGDLVTFTITVTNQGTVDAYNVEIVDYIPSGLTLADNDWAPGQDSDEAFTTLSGPIAANGGTVTVDITLLVDGTQLGGEILNFAEINSAEDVDGNNPPDIDSTPDNDDANDGDYTDNDINNTDGDEDDHDPAGVSVETFDLALIKVISDTQNFPVFPGDAVTYTITVTNQGTVDAYEIAVTDYIPNGLILADADWTLNGAQADLNTNIAFLATGASTSVDITFTISTSFTGTELVNYAEISAADDDTDPNNTPPTDIDSTPDDTNGNDAGGDPNGPTDNTTGGDGSGTPGDQNPNGDEDDHDPAVIPVGQIFDLALVKTLAGGQASVVSPGDLVNFTITVINQGTLPAYNIVVVDYLPDGTSLANAGWTSGAGSSVYQTIDGPLAPGASTTLNITVLLDPNFEGDAIENFAEIAFVDDDTDPNNTPPTDIDSTPDDNETNDGPVTDDAFNNENGDEDDHDPAGVTVEIFDLALTKVLSSAGPFQNGDLVTFTIEVTNQGNVDAYDISLVDYIPDGMLLADAQWVMTSSGDAMIASPIAGPLAPGSSTQVGITLQIDPAFSGSELINWAEIESADNDNDASNMQPNDIDSTPDDTQTNDAGGNPNSPTDNSVDGDGSGSPLDDNAAGDEDDQDPAYVPVNQIFDLALVKTLAITQSSVVEPGENIDYMITVINQGTLPAYNIQVVDYLPAGTTLADANWSPGAGNEVFTTFAGPLNPGATTVLMLTVNLDANFSGSSVTNFAEINAADDDQDPNNTPPTDIDSTPDNDVANDGPYEDDAFNNENGDEDDHDPAVVTVEPTPGIFDLALIKTLALGQENPVQVGDVVTFNIQVTNQGAVVADNIVITDYIPNCLTLNDADWMLSGTNTAAISLNASAGDANMPLLPGQSVLVPITFTVDACATGTLTNWAEISDATDGDGNPVIDIDSTPDDDQTNDVFTTDDDNSGNGLAGGDEDDHDPAEITVTDQVFDLALIKTLSPGQASVVAPGDLVSFTITVFNQGDVTATNISVVDYIPGGFSLADANWSAGSANTAFTTIAGPLVPGASIQVTISLMVTADSNVDLVNVAEIAGADDESGNPANDIDSDPNTDPTDDAGGAVNTPSDDVTGGDGTGTPGDTNPSTDEDDQDPALVMVEVPVCESVAGVVFIDADEDGCQDAGATGVAGVTVTLYECNADGSVTAVASTTTAADGSYEFGPDSPAGDLCLDANTLYQTQITNIPAGFANTTGSGIGCAGDNDDAPLNDGTSSCHNPTNDDPTDMDADEHIDFGLTPEPSCEAVAGVVFIDANDDGCQDNAADVLSGVTVTLYECNADGSTTPVATTTTAADGSYEFGPDAPQGEICLAADATYQVGISNLPAGYTNSTGAGDGCFGNNDDSPSNDGLSVCYDPEGEDDDNHIDFGVVPEPSCEAVAGVVFIDTNNDGCQDNAADVLAGVTVTLYECNTDGSTTPVATTTTATDGSYEFGPDAPQGEICLDVNNTYQVGISGLPAGYSNSTGAGSGCLGDNDDSPSNNGLSTCYDPEGEDDDNHIDFGVVPEQDCEEIGGVVFFDDNNDGCPDNAASGVAGVEIALYECLADGSITFVSMTTTAADGSYSFGPTDQGGNVCLDPDATYQTAINDYPSGYEHSTGAGNACANSSDDSPANNGQSNCYDPEGDDDDEHIDFGITPEVVEPDCEELAGVVFIDSDENGCQDTPSSVLAGVTVTLLECNADGSTTPVANTTTAADGSYSFGPDSPAGDLCLNGNSTYQVSISNLPSGYTNSTGAGSGCFGDNDDAPSNNGVSQCYDPTGDDDDQHIDFGVVPPSNEVFDLALTKVLAIGQSSTVQVGATVDFTITVFNQGTITATNIQVVDYLPSGLTLADADWSAGAGNTAYITLAGPLLPGESTTVDITVVVDANVNSGTLTNVSEITSASNENGVIADDVDSTPDNNPDNDAGGDPNSPADNATNGDGTGTPNDANPFTDEDDHDPAQITINNDVFDLALIKTLSANQSTTVSVGSLVNYTITIFNQGNITATNIDIMDYIPNGLALADADWTNLGNNQASYTLAGPLAPGQSESVEVTLMVMADATSGTLVNYAEISGAQDTQGVEIGDTDIDSSPDAINGNDAGGAPDTDSDNVIDGNGTGSNGSTISFTDEDDHDPAVVEFNITPLEFFDLALVKTLSAGQNSVVNPGDPVVFTITVYNQGNVTSTNIAIIDYLPDGLLLNDPTWTAVGSGLAAITIPGPLAPGESISIPIVTFVDENFQGGVLENVAEISAAEDENGFPADDEDSTPDMTNGNDGQPIDNNTNNAGDDEDDHDPASVTVVEPILGDCDDPATCTEETVCTEAITPIVLCPDFCLTGDFMIVDAESTFDCAIQVTEEGDCIVYTPLPGMENVGFDMVTIIGQNANGECVEYIYNIEIGGCNENNPPTILNTDLEFCASPMVAITICIDAEDIDGDDVTICDVETLSNCNINVIDDLCFVYVPLPLQEGTDMVTVTVCDDGEPVLSDSITFPVVVGCETPTAIDDLLFVDNDAATFNSADASYNNGVVTMNVLENDEGNDPCYGGLSLTSIVDGPDNGLAQIVNGQIQYEPTEGFVGQDEITYEICNGCGECDQAVVSIDADLEICINIYETCTEPITPVQICVEFCNVPDANIVALESLFDCGVELQENNCFQYIPLPGLTGTDSVTVLGMNDAGLTDESVVYIDVDGCEPLIAIDDVAFTTQGSDVTMNVRLNDQSNSVMDDPIIETAPANGTAIVNLDGTVSYTPDLTFNGVDILTYKVCNTNGQCDEAIVLIDVEELLFAAPLLSDDVVIAQQGLETSIDALDNDIDPNGDDLFIVSVASSVNGAASIYANEIVYTSNPDFTGIDQVTYIACDQSGNCESALVVISVLEETAEIEQIIAPQNGGLINSNGLGIANEFSDNNDQIENETSVLEEIDSQENKDENEIAVLDQFEVLNIIQTDGQVKALIQSDQDYKLNAQLTDLNGKVISSIHFNVTSGSQVVDLMPIKQATGLYLVSVQKSDYKKTMKVIKQ